ncbi:helix-turn-helix domain-containing protein [Nonomuraea sp. NPDC050691]|uniref:helix-turn-helix domain-containing protein n=1 Tax=Nonomuraea sp. NPDC050691 TaxID=3155661 RepID=UPI0033D0BA09
MRRSVKFLLRPTVKQAAALTQCLEDHRQLYNAALEHRRTAHGKAGVTVRYGEQSAEGATWPPAPTGSRRLNATWPATNADPSGVARRWPGWPRCTPRCGGNAWMARTRRR